jgi:hypothetical protein
MTGQYASFHFYVVSLCIALSTNKRDLYYNNLIISIFIISALCVILGAVFLWQGLVVGEDVWELKQEIEYYALEPFTVASGAVTNLICILFLFNNKRNKFYHSCLLKIINQI